MTYINDVNKSTAMPHTIKNQPFSFSFKVFHLGIKIDSFEKIADSATIQQKFKLISIGISL